MPRILRHHQLVLGWRFTPYLEFRVDRSYEYGSRIERCSGDRRRRARRPDGDEEGPEMSVLSDIRDILDQSRAVLLVST